MNTTLQATVTFPAYSGLRCLMMPYVQGEPDSLPDGFDAYADIVASTFVRRGDVGFLTIDESEAKRGTPHRGARARHARALHTEAGLLGGRYGWGGRPVWGGRPAVTLDEDVAVLLANNIDGTCAIWPVVHADTSEDGDIGHAADRYPYAEATVMRAGEVHRIGILTPHESLPLREDARRQFLRIVGAGVHGREPYFTVNPKMSEPRATATGPRGAKC